MVISWSVTSAWPYAALPKGSFDRDETDRRSASVPPLFPGKGSAPVTWKPFYCMGM